MHPRKGKNQIPRIRDISNRHRTITGKDGDYKKTSVDGKTTPTVPGDDKFLPEIHLRSS